MVAPVAMDLRACIVTAYEDGDTQDEIAERFNITQATVSRLLKKFRTEGHLIPGKAKGRSRILTDDDAPVIRAIISEQPDLTLTDLAKEINNQLDKVVSNPTLCKHLKFMGLIRKKKSRQAAERERPDVQKKELTT